MEPVSEALQEPQLRPIPDRIASRVGTECQVQPDDCAPGSDIGDADAVQFATLETEELLMGRTRCSGDLPNAQAGADSSQSMLLPYATEAVTRSSAPPIRWSLSISHGADDRARPFTADRLHLGPPAGPTGEQADRCVRYALSPVLNGPLAGPTGEEEANSGRIGRDLDSPSAPWSASRTKDLAAAAARRNG
jgi:hypothetical protein